MRIGDVLVASGQVHPEEVERALEYQRQYGGRLGDILVGLGVISAEGLEMILHGIPQAPKSIADTGITAADLLTLLVKLMYTSHRETVSELSAAIMLPAKIVTDVLNDAKERKLVEVLGTSDNGLLQELRYALSELGRRRAIDSLDVNQYVGPAPVSLAHYHERIHRQRITNERIGHHQLQEAFEDLTIPDEFMHRLGPGVNSGRCILLYGPAGNGKTSIAERVGRIFSDIIYIPYCFEVEGQIVKVYDPSIHEAIQRPSTTDRSRSLRREEFDKRWVPCKRPVILTGGELTLEMLDLKFSEIAKFYEAPLHVKALGGTFIIDDFGRQLVSPEALLNRWIVPLNSRVDYLKLHTGKSFQVPFDELIIFSTNMDPQDLMDPAFLRRIPYKLQTEPPHPDIFYKIFSSVAAKEGMELPDDIFDYVVHQLTERNKFNLACYQPRFVIDQVIAACKYEGVPSGFTTDRVKVALANLYTNATFTSDHRPLALAAE